MTFPYLTKHEIEELFEKRGSQETKSQFGDALATNLQGHVAGYDHDLSGDTKGKDAWIKEAENKVSGVLDIDKGISMEIVHVQGGGNSPWACVEMKTSGKTKVGMELPFIHVPSHEERGQTTPCNALVNDLAVS